MMRAAWLAVVVLVSACGAQPTPDAGMQDAGSTGGGGGAMGGGAGGGSGVDAGACTSECEPWAVCEARACVSRALSIVWDAPGDGFRVDAGMVELRAKIVPFRDRVPYEPPTLVARLTPPTSVLTIDVELLRGDGGYSAMTSLTAGSWTATTSLGPIMATQRFDVGAPLPEPRVTLAPPADAGMGTVEVTFIDPVLPGAYRRDEIVPLRLDLASGDADPDSMQVTMRSGAESFVLPRITCPAQLPCATTACRCFEADLAAPRLDGFRGNMNLEVTVRSLDGIEVVRASTTAGTLVPSIPVTRWGWRRRFFQPEDAVSQVDGPYLALDERGRLLVSERQMGTVAAAGITAHGQLAWSRTLWATAPLVVGRWPDAGTVVHLPVFETGVITVSAATGATVEQAMVPLPTAVQTPMALLDRPTANGVEQVLLGLSDPLDPYSHRPFAWSPRGWQVTNNSVTSGSKLSASIDGDELVWSHLDFQSQPRVSRMRYDGAGFVPLSHQMAASPSGAVQLVPTDAGVVLGLGTSSGTSWARWELDGGVGSLTSGQQMTGFTMTSESELIGIRYSGASSVQLVRLSVGAASPSAQAALPAIAFGGPALGTGGLVYVTDTTGAVRAFRRSDLVELWSAVVPTERFEGAMQLDCARNAQGDVIAGRPGRLLAVGTSGRAYSFITDSRGIDPQATWPLELHDPANTNNRATPLSRFVCP